MTDEPICSLSCDEAIEHDAASLIEEYENTRGVTIEPPIPVEDIVEKYLKLRIEFDDMHARHNIPRPPNGQSDILGAIYNDGSIFIDESLDPEEYPENLGRYRFTLAHELGHSLLHRNVFSIADANAPMRIHPRLEWQANLFAACFLMPIPMVAEAWVVLRRSSRPWVFRFRYGDPEQQPPYYWREEPVTLFSDDEKKSIGFHFDKLSEPFACWFDVSVEAARIRLQHLGFLRKEGIIRRLPIAANNSEVS